MPFCDARLRGSFVLGWDYFIGEGGKPEVLVIDR